MGCFFCKYSNLKVTTYFFKNEVTFKLLKFQQTIKHSALCIMHFALRSRGGKVVKCENCPEKKRADHWHKTATFLMSIVGGVSGGIIGFFITKLVGN